MNNLSTYIIEKLKINKDSTVFDGYGKMVPLILALCEVAPSKFDDFPKWLEDNKKNVYYETVRDWVNDNEIDGKNLTCYTDKTKLKKWVKTPSVVEWFQDDPDYAFKISEELIADKKGKEVLGPTIRDPFMYYNNEALIYHEYDPKLGNIDRIFVKK